MAEGKVEPIKVGMLGIEICNGKFKVRIWEQYTNDEGTEKGRWVPSKAQYFDSLDDTLKYIADQKETGGFEFVEA